MEILADKYKLKIKRPESRSEAEYRRRDIVERLIGFITLTEEDRLKAGIYIGSEGRDWLDKAALMFPPIDLK
jgi:hypothetical protein